MYGVKKYNEPLVRVDREPTLENMQKDVDGFIEYVSLQQ
jgi:hypothetical protein